MKKFTATLFSVACTTMLLHAQITVTQSNMPALGNQFIDVTDSSGTITSPGSGGASQAWNFSTMNAKSPDTANVVSISSTPAMYSSQFPAANLALAFTSKQPNTARYEYINSSASSLTLNGLVFNSSTYGNIVYKYNPAWIYTSFPVTYQSHWNGTYRVDMKTAYSGSGYDSIQIVQDGTYRDTIDGWGNVTTPAGTFNSLRNHHLETDIDSESVHLTSTHTWQNIGTFTAKSYSYTWMSDNANYYIAQLTMDSSDSKVVGGTWLKNAVAGVNEVQASSNATIYFPNPATEELNIQTTATETGTVYVYDINGKQVESQPLHNGRIVLNTLHYADGMYLFTVADKSGNVIDRQKFTVAR